MKRLLSFVLIILCVLTSVQASFACNQYIQPYSGIPTEKDIRAKDDCYSTEKNTALNIICNGVMSNDVIPKSYSNVYVTLKSKPANGKVQLNSNGTFTYTPDNNFYGEDNFEYTLSVVFTYKENNKTKTTTLTSNAKVRITVTKTQKTKYVRIQNVTTGIYIDGMGRAKDGNIACQWGNSGSDNQQWEIIKCGSYVRFKNRATGKFLDGLGYAYDGADCGQWGDSGHDNQQWELVTSGGYTMIKNRATGLYLDGCKRNANGDNLGQWKFTNSTNQKWRIVEVN